SAPVAGTMLLTNVMVVHPDVPAKTVAEFIAYAKANPGKINMASGGSGRRCTCRANNKAVNAVLADPKLEARLVQLGGVPMPMTRAQLGKLIGDETEKWAKVVKFSGGKPD